MKALCKSIVCLFAVAFSISIFAAFEIVPDDRDQQVLNALLSHLLTASDFDLTRTSTNGTNIVLHARTPEKTGFLQSGQMRSDTDNQTFPAGAVDNLCGRNTPPDAKPDTYIAVAASYTNLTFGTNIIVADLSSVWSNRRRSFSAFEDAYPNARGYVRAYLPGYSKDGNQAVVRATVGPTPHGAVVTAILEKAGNKWTVKWYRIARFV